MAKIGAPAVLIQDSRRLAQFTLMYLPMQVLKSLASVQILAGLACHELKSSYLLL